MSCVCVCVCVEIIIIETVVVDDSARLRIVTITFVHLCAIMPSRVDKCARVQQ